MKQLTRINRYGIALVAGSSWRAQFAAARPLPSHLMTPFAFT